ncbi:MAG: glycosyltransferase family 39 protein [Planctomycetes bacterium]|nr:glycosyltransferase family 39 protein [Planctomycetota bacterium]
MSNSTQFRANLAEEPQTPLALLLTAMLLAVVPLIVVSQIAAHLRFDVVDDQMFGYFGWRIARGAVIYRDIWDNKPPGIYWINALGMLLAGGSYIGVIALCAAALVATHALFFLICASNYFRGAAAVATVLASFFVTHGYFQGGTNRTETFLIPFELAGVLLYMRGFYRDQAWRWPAAGICCGCAFLCKQVGLAAWGAMGIHLIFLAAIGELTWRVAVRRGLLLAVGAAVPMLAAAGVLAAQGALNEALFATFGFNKYYVEHGASNWTDTFLNRHLLLNHMQGLLTLPVVLAIAAVIHSTLWYLRPSQRPAEIDEPIRAFRPVCPHPMFLFFVWYAISFYGAAISPHAFRHYLLPTFPPLLLMCAHLINLLKTEARLIDRLQRRAWVTGAFVLMGYLALDSIWNNFGEVSRVWVNRFDRHKQAPWEEVGDAVKKLTQPGERVQFLGYMPGVYLRAQRDNACRFTTTEKIGQLGKKVEYQQYEIRDALAKNPPALFGMSANDYAMAQEPTDDWWNPWLSRFVADNYTKAEEIFVEDDNYFLFKRKDKPDAGR